MDIPEIATRRSRAPSPQGGGPASTEPSSKKAIEEAFYAKLGPTPAFPRG